MLSGFRKRTKQTPTEIHVFFFNLTFHKRYTDNIIDNENIYKNI